MLNYWAAKGQQGTEVERKRRRRGISLEELGEFYRGGLRRSSIVSTNTRFEPEHQGLRVNSKAVHRSIIQNVLQN
jgi:hypothetical protein